MRRIASVVFLTALSWASVNASNQVFGSDSCWTDSTLGVVICSADGVLSGPSVPGVTVGDPDNPTDPGRQFVYTATDATIGACYFWSDVPGGLDAWDPASDAAVIAITTTLPLCPAVIVPPVDLEATAWAIFRSWDLDVPEPEITPAERGITGIATQIGVGTPDAITYAEVLPDSRLLEVRARAAILVVDWGDGAVTTSDPATATGYPDGTAAHVYERKTCTEQYRAEHPSGGLCHPSAEYYQIVASYVWSGEYNIGSGWQLLGTLTVSAEPNSYDVDEARGITTP